MAALVLILTFLKLHLLNADLEYDHADIPLVEAVAGIRVAWNQRDGFTVNPTTEQMARSKLDLVMAGTQDKLLMVEGFCEFLSDDNMKEVDISLKLHCAELALFSNATSVNVCGPLASFDVSHQSC